MFPLHYIDHVIGAAENEDPSLAIGVATLRHCCVSKVISITKSAVKALVIIFYSSDDIQHADVYDDFTGWPKK